MIRTASIPTAETDGIDNGIVPAAAGIRFVNNIFRAPLVNPVAIRGVPGLLPSVPGLVVNIFVDGVLIVNGLLYRLATEYLPIIANPGDPTRHTVTWQIVGIIPVVTLSQVIRVKKGRHYTMIASGNFTGTSDGLLLTLYQDDLQCPVKKVSRCKGKKGRKEKLSCAAKISFINSVNRDPVDVYLDDFRLFQDVPYPVHTDTRCIWANTYPFRVTRATEQSLAFTRVINPDNPNPLSLAPNEIAINSNQVLVGPFDIEIFEGFVYTLILTGSGDNLGIIVLKALCFDGCRENRCTYPRPKCKPTCKEKKCNKGNCQRGCDCWDIVVTRCPCPPGCREVFESEQFAEFINPRRFD